MLDRPVLVEQSKGGRSNTRARWRRVGVLALACLLAAGITTHAFAEGEPEPSPATASETAPEEPASKKLDFTIHHPDDPEHWLLPSVRWDTVSITGFNAWAGNVKDNIGNKSNGWMEIGLLPALDGQYSLGSNGTLSARMSGVYTTTQLGLDWGGSNFIGGETKHPEEITLEDAYVKWTSGDLFPSLGKDALELSTGSQPYDVGNGFLFGNAGSDGGKRGGYWLGLRKAFELTGVARLKTGEFTGETVYLRSDDLGGDHTNTAGANFDYDFGKLLDIESLKLGLGYWNLFNSDNERRDGLNVLDVRLDTLPFSRVESIAGLGFSGEFVKQKNRSKNDSWAITGTISYDFAAHDVAAVPYVSYRFAFFSGDDQAGDNDNRFDPLYYTFNDWNQWYIGEILGEWVAGNSNINVNILRLRLSPTDSLSVNLFYIYSRVNEKQGTQDGPGGRPVDPRVVAIGDKDIAHELDLIGDWAVNDYLSTSFVTAVMIPMSGAKDFFGNDEVWTEFLFNTSVRF